MKNWKILEARKAPVKNPYYKVEFEGGPTHRSKKKLEYEYYICDYCGEPIKLEDKVDKRKGGTVRIPINPYKTLLLALHTECLKPTLKEINQIYGINV